MRFNWRGLALLVAPCGMEAPWLPKILHLLHEVPRKIRYRSDLVVNAVTGLALPSLNKFRLTLRLLSVMQVYNWVTSFSSVLNLGVADQGMGDDPMVSRLMRGIYLNKPLASKVSRNT